MLNIIPEKTLLKLEFLVLESSSIGIKISNGSIFAEKPIHWWGIFLQEWTIWVNPENSRLGFVETKLTSP